MENFKLKNRWIYGGSLALLWLLAGVVFFYILDLLFWHAKEESSLLIPYSTYMLTGVFISWIHSRTYYALTDDTLQTRRQGITVNTVIIKEIAETVHYKSPKFNFIHGWYNICLTTHNGKKFYLYPENEKKLLTKLKEKGAQI